MTEENANVPPAAAPAKNNKTLYIIVGVVLAILVLGLLSRGMSMMSAGVIGAATGVDIDQNLDGSATYSNAEGSVTIGGNKMPDNWPSDVPGVYAGGTIQYSGASNPQTGQAGSALVYTVKAPGQSVIDFYKSELTKGGWNIEATANTGGAMVLSAKKDERTVGMYVVDAGDGTVSVTVGIDM